VNLETPEVRYARSGDVSIAYQVVGDGPVDVRFVSFLINLVWAWEQPIFVDFCRIVASFSRLILLDKRGTGLSDRPRDLPTFETRMDDLRAVIDAAGSEKAALLGAGSPGGQLCAVFAATYPERVQALILQNTWPRVGGRFRRPKRAPEQERDGGVGQVVAPRRGAPVARRLATTSAVSPPARLRP
jgi:pimeloyl-ACP methyl ester carboxylesterase